YASDRGHVFIAGFPGFGKSTLMLFMALQHVGRGEGCMVLDAHGDLTRLFLTHIPRDRWDDVVYIDPTTAFDYGFVVQMNFLEYNSEGERDVVARSFMDCLMKFYGRFWGPRLDMILLNALYLLLDSGNARLGDLYRVIADEGFREHLLGRVRDERVKGFWLNEYKRMPKDASSGALTKIYRLVQERVAAPMFECERSSVDFRNLMDQRKIVVVNLSEGALTSDLVNFIGSLLIGKLYLAGMSREDTPEDQRVPFYVYIDESPRFATSGIRDILQSLRKYRVYLTLSAQYIEQFRRDVAQSIPSLCSTIICFSAGENTAKTLEEFFRSSDITYKNLMDLPKYYFAVSTPVKGRRECMMLKTVDIGRGESNPEEVVKNSLKMYGRAVDASSFMGPPSIGVHPYPELTPAQWLILVKLYSFQEEAGNGSSAVELENLAKMLESEYGIQHLDIVEALRGLCRKGWVFERDREVRWVGVQTPEPPWFPKQVQCHKCGFSTNRPFILADGKVLCQRCAESALARGDRKPKEFIQPTMADGELAVVNRGKTVKHYALRATAKNAFFEDVPRGRRGGGDRHTLIIGILADRRRMGGSYCFIDLGEETPRKTVDGDTIVYEAKEKPDILVYPLKIDCGKADAKFWDATHPYTIEVEINPSRHKSRVSANLEKCRRRGMPTIFATDNPEEARKLLQTIIDHGFNVVRDNLDPYNPKAVTVLYVDPETGMEMPVVSQNQPLAAEWEKAKANSITPETETVRVEVEDVRAEEQTAKIKPDVEAKIIFHAASKCQFRRRLIEGAWRLIASKNVGGKIYEADLGPINSDLEEKLKMLGIEAPAEAPSKTLESKEAIMDKAGERFKRIKEYADWGLKIKVVNGKAYLCTKSRRVGGKVVTKSLGPYNEEAKRILEKLKINVEEPRQKRSKA
ncbi:MAG: type IV secretion system DNA-binding domain-containing protein, partial [Candidatus Bathyarchaeia archaeon]